MELEPYTFVAQREHKFPSTYPALPKKKEKWHPALE